MIRELDVKNAIIFCNRKRDVAILLKSLQKHGFNAGALHGDMDQMSRMATLDAFREGRITLLAASDVAARGLDIPDVSHIFNFDVPWQADDYVHRIGRTGRAGKEGFSATIVTPDDLKSVDAISRLIGQKTVWMGPEPDADTIAESKSRRGRGRRGGPPRRGDGRDRHPRGPDHARPRHKGDDGLSAEKRDGNRARNGAPPAAVQRNDRNGQRDQRPRDGRHSSEPTAPASRRPANENQPRSREKNAAQRTPEQRSPVGLGEHVPAFLRRPVRAAGH
jgi:superfamily II DNA/RNA helicase